MNVAETEVQAWDGQLNYEFALPRFGRFNLYSVATRATKFERQLLPTSAPFDTVDYREGPLKWRGNIGFGWSLGRFSLSWNSQFYSSYSIRLGSNPTGATSTNDVNRQGSSRIPSQVYHDLSAKIRFSGTRNKFLRAAEIALGVANLLDRRPPPIAAATATGTYSPYGDPRLRRYSISLRKDLFTN